jgi:hypothetical protein
VAAINKLMTGRGVVMMPDGQDESSWMLRAFGD